MIINDEWEQPLPRPWSLWDEITHFLFHRVMLRLMGYELLGSHGRHRQFGFYIVKPKRWTVVWGGLGCGHNSYIFNNGSHISYGWPVDRAHAGAIPTCRCEKQLVQGARRVIRERRR